MQLVSSECIILRNQDYLERDRLVTFLTRDAGRLRGIAKGSRKLTSRGVGNFEPFSRGVMYYTERGQGGLVSIRKCDPLPPYLYLQGDYHKFLYAGYFAELMDLIPIDPAGAEPYFTLLAESVEALCEPGPARRLPLLRLRFELHFLQLLGYLPDWARCCHCGASLLREENERAVPVYEAPYQFDVREGGVRCPDCASSDPHRLVVSPASLAFLENWRRGADGAVVRPTRLVLEELERAVTRHLVHCIEREPRSLGMLPTLDALEPSLHA
ncbi:MAG TPA: DNA repair protein RecO [bacterium]|nr:DNA repair protein RecO [bacterium]